MVVFDNVDALARVLPLLADAICTSTIAVMVPLIVFLSSAALATMCCHKTN